MSLIGEPPVTKTVLTTREVAEMLVTEEWRVRRLFEDGTLPDPPRFGRARMIPRSAIPAVVAALQATGWLPPTAECAETLRNEAAPT